MVTQPSCFYLPHASCSLTSNLPPPATWCHLLPPTRTLPKAPAFPPTSSTLPLYLSVIRYLVKPGGHLHEQPWSLGHSTCYSYTTCTAEPSREPSNLSQVKSESPQLSRELSDGGLPRKQPKLTYRGREKHEKGEGKLYDDDMMMIGVLCIMYQGAGVLVVHSLSTHAALSV